MTPLLAHVDIAPFAPPAVLVAVAAVVVLGATRVRAGLDERAEKPSLISVSAGNWLAIPIAGLVALLIWRTAVAAVPGEALGWGWLAVTVGAVVWVAASPFRRLAAVTDTGEAAGPSQTTGTTVAAVGVAVLGWAQLAAITPGTAAAVVGFYVGLQALAGLWWGPGWPARGESIDRYAALVLAVVRRSPSDPPVVFLGALLAVPITGRLLHSGLWLDLTRTVAGWSMAAVTAGLLVAVTVVAIGGLRLLPRAGLLAPAVLAAFVSHQLATVFALPLVLPDAGAPSPWSPSALAATALPVVVLLAGLAYSAALVSGAAAGLSRQTAERLRWPLLTVLLAGGAAGAVVWSAPL